MSGRILHEWRPSPRGKSLRERIALLYGTLFAVVLLAIMLLVSSGIERFGETNATRDLAANARVFDQILELRANQMQEAAQVLARDFGFREAVATNDPATLSSALRSLRDRSESSTAFVVGLDASLTADETRGLPPGDSLLRALDGGRESGIVLLSGQPALASASPIEAPDLIGWLVLAQTLDGSEMDRLEELSAVETDGFVRPRTELAPYLEQAPMGQVFEASKSARDLYQVTALPALQEGLEPRLVLHHSLGDALLEYNDLKILMVIVSLAGLALAILLGMRIARAINNAIEEREQKIVHVGQHDGLTGLPNRKHFGEQLDEALARRKGSERILVAYCDLDDFKSINDSFGHPTGDALLCAVADSFRQALPTGVVGRLGGDEFAVMVCETGAGLNLTEVAQTIRDALVGTFELGDRTIQNSGSVGIAVAPHDGTGSVEIVKKADLALYRAKKGGKAAYHFYDSSLDEEERSRSQLETDLRAATAGGQFELLFQPLFSLEHRELEGFEALVRWDHPTRGLIGPDRFIPLAEETGLIVQIGEWVLREACRAAVEWPGNLTVAVNISPKQFCAPGFAGTVMQAFSQAGLAPQRLELELTESIFISDIGKTLAKLKALRQLGVSIALDDFGTGDSSFSYLRSFPFDKLKIDRSYVQELDGEGPHAQAMIRAITTLADALGMETLAEGVESDDQLEILRAAGCGHMQGYLVSEPLRRPAVHDFISKSVAETRVA